MRRSSKTVTVKLSEDLNAKLNKLAQKMKKTKSVVLRLALEELLRQPNAVEKLSAFEVLSDFCGAITELPKDLSYSKTHMKGYGE